MRTKEDARVLKTKDKLFTAFQGLLSEKTFEEITVNEICVKADVRRATFYKHFNDKYDFLSAMVADLIGRFDARMKSKYKSYPVEYHVEYERRLLEFLLDNDELVGFILKSNMISTVVMLIVNENYKVLLERLTHSVENGEKLVADVRTVATALSGGIGNIIIRWFAEGKPCSKDAIMGEMDSIVRAMFVEK